MTDFKKPIFLLDWKGTVLNESMEYGASIQQSAMVIARHIKEKSGENLDFEVLYKEIRTAHANTSPQSDWSLSIYDQLPILRNTFKDTEKRHDVIKEAIEARLRYSRENTKVYEGVSSFLDQAQQQGLKVYTMTDAALESVLMQLKQVGLDNHLISKIYGGAAHPESLAAYGVGDIKTPYASFLGDRVKPDGRIIAEIALDHAKNNEGLPDKVAFEDVFGFVPHPEFRLEDQFFASSREKKEYAWLHHAVVLKETKYARILKNVLDSIVVIGDSSRDKLTAYNVISGLAANNKSVGVAFVQASWDKEWVKAHADPKAEEESLHVLHKVTGWSDARIRLLDEIKAKPHVEKCPVALTLKSDQYLRILTSMNEGPLPMKERLFHVASLLKQAEVIPGVIVDPERVVERVHGMQIDQQKRFSERGR